MSSCCKSEFQQKNLFFGQCEPELFYRSQWSENYPYLWGWKLFSLVYWFIWTVHDHAAQSGQHPHYVSLTSWASFTVFLYFLASFGVASYGIKGVRMDHMATIESDRSGSSAMTSIFSGNGGLFGRHRLRWFHKCVWLLHTAATDICYLVTLLYVAIIRPFNVSSGSINNHVVSSLFMLIDTLIVNFPVRLFHFYHASNYLIIYTLFTLLLHGVGGISRAFANILDWKSLPGRTAFDCVLGVFGAAPAIHAVNFGIYQLRSCFAGVSECREARRIESRERERQRSYAPTVVEV